MSAAVIAAISCVALTKVVTRGLPFQFTTERTKLLPVTVSVNAADPHWQCWEKLSLAMERDYLC